MTAIADNANTALEHRRAAAKAHLWPHFTPLTAHDSPGVPTIVRGEGPYVYDDTGRRFFDGLSGLFVVQAGHGREELADAAARQARELGYFPLWSFDHPSAIDLAERIANEAPGDLNRVFFTSGGSEAVETAWKLIKQYFKLTGKPMKHKVISRTIAYHGTTHGALSINGIPAHRQTFEPLVPGTHKAANTNIYRSPIFGDDPKAFGEWVADEIERAILMEGADSVAAVFLEPVQNAGGCFPPPPGYFQRVREICDRHDVLLVSDEVICAWGRLGHAFGASRYGYQPDIITCAKGLTSGYAPLGATIISDRIAEPFLADGVTFPHGITFGGHPVACAIALANLDLFEREDLYGNVQRNQGALRSTLEKLYDLPIVGDVRGDGYFYGVELVKDKATKESFTAEEASRILYGYLSPALLEHGLYCRADDRGDPVIQLAPPLICGQEHFDEIEGILREVLTTAYSKL